MMPPSLSQMNGMVQQQHNNQLPPPPPGFMQPSAHMNSFGSKILPYLNMGSSNQSATSSQQQQQQHNGWPNGYNLQQQHKGLLLFISDNLDSYKHCCRSRYL